MAVFIDKGVHQTILFVGFRLFTVVQTTLLLFLDQHLRIIGHGIEYKSFEQSFLCRVDSAVGVKKRVYGSFGGRSFVAGSRRIEPVEHVPPVVGQTEHSGAVGHSESHTRGEYLPRVGIEPVGSALKTHGRGEHKPRIVGDEPVGKPGRHCLTRSHSIHKSDEILVGFHHQLPKVALNICMTSSSEISSHS